jgi:hypothetical protein
MTRVAPKWLIIYTEAGASSVEIPKPCANKSSHNNCIEMEFNVWLIWQLKVILIKKTIFKKKLLNVLLCMCISYFLSIGLEKFHFLPVQFATEKIEIKSFLRRICSMLRCFSSGA